jgi:hypothetical protein
MRLGRCRLGVSVDSAEYSSSRGLSRRFIKLEKSLPAPIAAAAPPTVFISPPPKPDFLGGGDAEYLSSS